MTTMENFRHHMNMIMVEDDTVAIDFSKEIIKRFETCQRTVFLPERDMPAGISYFDALFSGIEFSKHTVVIVTPEFLMDNSWYMYCYRTAYESLCNSKSRYFTVICLGVEERQLRDKIDDDNSKVIYFPVQWKNDQEAEEEGWTEIREHLFS